MSKDNSGGIVSALPTSNRIWKVGVANKYLDQVVHVFGRSCTSNSETFRWSSQYEILSLPVQYVAPSGWSLLSTRHQKQAVIQIVTHVKIHLQAKQSKATTKSLQIAQ